jgi:hypothetical protein
MSRDIFNNPKFEPTSRFLSKNENSVLNKVLQANSEGKVKKGNNLNIFKNKSLKQILNGLVDESKVKNKVAAVSSTHTNVFPGPLSAPATAGTPSLPTRKFTKNKSNTAESWLNNPTRLMSFNKTRNLQRRGVFPGPLSSPETLTMKPITAWKNANARSRKAKKSRKTRRTHRKH